MSCLICERIEMIKSRTNPYFVTELETGYVVMGDHQRFRGYTLFLCKEHLTELHQLEHHRKIKHLEEMSLVAEAVYNAFQPDKLNYELLGNGENSSHIHWHIIPRTQGDMPRRGPVWFLPVEELYNDMYKPNNKQLSDMISRLRNEIVLLCTK